MKEAGTVTGLLHEWRGGNPDALDRLMPMVYAELRRRAQIAMRGERPGHTLAPTELVHEAFLRLVDADISWEDRAHFLAAAATAMRRVLLDHAKARLRQKRGGGAVLVSLVDVAAADGTPIEDFIALDAALTRLAAEDERRSRMIELRYFGGLNLEETGAVLGLSTATVHRELKLARAWLMRELER
jgi:RNA polymerase sigma factor (TIGR02999 family)